MDVKLNLARAQEVEAFEQWQTESENFEAIRVAFLLSRTERIIPQNDDIVFIPEWGHPNDQQIDPQKETLYVGFDLGFEEALVIIDLAKGAIRW